MTTLTMDSRRTRMQWRDVLDTVSSGESDVLVTRNNKETVAIIPAADYEAIAEHLADIRESRLADTLIDKWKQGQITARPWAALRNSLLEGIDDGIHRDSVGASSEGSGDD